MPRATPIRTATSSTCPARCGPGATGSSTRTATTSLTIVSSPTRSQADATFDQRLATGFNRNHNITTEGGAIDEEYKAIYVSDRIDTLGTAMLGMSVGCARCHDHKFDPIRQEDYYRLFACFNQTEERGLGPDNGYAPTIEVTSPLATREIRAIDERIAALHAEVAGPWDLSAWAAESEEQLPIDWTSVRPSLVDADNDTDLVVESDDSITAYNQEVRDAYHIELPVPEGTRAIEIEAIEGYGPDKSFVLTEVEGLTVDRRGRLE